MTYLTPEVTKSIQSVQTASGQGRGKSGTITAVVNALAKAGVDLGDNGSIIPRQKGKR
jgi:hypothetical protein